MTGASRQGILHNQPNHLRTGSIGPTLIEKNSKAETQTNAKIARNIATAGPNRQSNSTINIML